MDLKNRCIDDDPGTIQLEPLNAFLSPFKLMILSKIWGVVFFFNLHSGGLICTFGLKMLQVLLGHCNYLQMFHCLSITLPCFTFIY